MGHEEADALGLHPAGGNHNTPKKTMKSIGIFIGHSRKIGNRYDGGAADVDGLCERDFNRPLGQRIAKLLEEQGIKAHVVADYQGDGYGEAMVWVGRECQRLGVNAAVELHFNSANPSAAGHEWLHWHSSAASKYLAEKLDASFSAAFPDSKRRGVKLIEDGGRGGEFLRRTPCPAVICEPFFGSNPEEVDRVAGQPERLASAIAGGILAWLGIGTSTPGQPAPPPITVPDEWIAKALSCTRRADGSFDVRLEIKPKSPS